MDILAGMSVGFAEVLVGYPFLTAKVLSQNGHKWWGLAPKRYYQGVKYPLMSSVAYNALVFPVKDRAYPYTGNYFIAGAIAGIAVTPQAFFIDTYTIRRQTNQRVHIGMFKGSRGFASTMARESVALSTYFGTYHAMREHYNSILSGATAGLLNWTMSFPLDTIRTRQIAQRCSVRDALRGSMWKGFPIAAARSVVVNAVSFTLYECFTPTTSKS